MELATCEKYYDKIKERFPELSYKQIDKIIKKGLRSFYLTNLYGGDVLLKHQSYAMYTGRLFLSNLTFHKYWRVKWKIKLRIKYKREKTKYDGYYYFGLTDERFQEFQSNFKSKGRRRVKVRFTNLMMYKILDECLLHTEYKHIFKIEYPEDCGFTMYKENYEARNFEYILKRNKDNSVEPVAYEQKDNNKYVKRRVK